MQDPQSKTVYGMTFKIDWIYSLHSIKNIVWTIMNQIIDSNTAGLKIEFQ